jgi:hypothetical protein
MRRNVGARSNDLSPSPGRRSVSEVCREALLIGLAAMEMLDEEPALRGMHPRERRSLVRQALQAELRRDD